MTNMQFAKFCVDALDKKTLYMWGTYGNFITKTLCNSKFKQYPKNYSQARRIYLLSKAISDPDTHTCDCAGLIKWFLWSKGDINLAKVPYSSKTDRNCSGLYSAAKEKGKISTMPDVPGIVVYKSGHVGVYIGDDQVIECTLGKRGDGVVRSQLGQVAWTHWLKVPEIEYMPTAPVKIMPYQKKQTVISRLKSIFGKDDI